MTTSRRYQVNVVADDSPSGASRTVAVNADGWRDARRRVIIRLRNHGHTVVYAADVHQLTASGPVLCFVHLLTKSA